MKYGDGQVRILQNPPATPEAAHACLFVEEQGELAHRLISQQTLYQPLKF